jgi:hypothetical protein
VNVKVTQSSGEHCFNIGGDELIGWAELSSNIENKRVSDRLTIQLILK